MYLYVLFIYLVGFNLQSQLGHEESHIFLHFSIAELCHSLSVLLVQVVHSTVSRAGRALELAGPSPYLSFHWHYCFPEVLLIYFLSELLLTGPHALHRGCPQ